MPAGRILKKKISYDEDVAKLSTEAALLYTWCIPHLDVEGRIYADPHIIKGMVVPYRDEFTEQKIVKCMQEMVVNELILLYGADKKYARFTGFDKNQALRKDREAPSEIPEPTPDLLQSNSGVNPEQIQSNSGLSKVKLSKVKRKDLGPEFLEYFNQKTGKKYSLTPERRRIIEQRLTTHSLDDLKKAVDNFVQDDWTERHKYMDVIYCIGVRNKIDNLEKWLNYRTKAPKNAPKPVDRVTNPDKAKRLLERERTTTAMIRCLTELPESDRKELVAWIQREGSYLRPLYENALKILKERKAHEKG
jgi:uncharacterized phage protein (TIGR02220 family)